MNPVRSSESSCHSGWVDFVFSAQLLLGTGACQKPFPSLIHIGVFRLFVSLEKDGGVLLFNSHEFSWRWWAWAMKGKTRTRTQILSKHSGDGASQTSQVLCLDQPQSSSASRSLSISFGLVESW